MKRFLAVYMGSTSGEKMNAFKSMDEKTRKEREHAGMNAWMKWGELNKGAIVDMGSPLGKTKLVDNKGVSDTKNLMTGYTIIEAESHEAAAKMFREHPHFSIFPGDSVEVMEILPMPSMG